MLTLKEILKSAKFEEMFHSTGCMCVECQPPREKVPRSVEENAMRKLHGVLFDDCDSDFERHDTIGLALMAVTRIKRLTEENKRLTFMIENGLGPEDMERDIDGR